jgi:hypothetical protein
MKAHQRRKFDGSRESWQNLIKEFIESLDARDSTKARLYSKMTTDEMWEKFKKDKGLNDDAKSE